MDRKTVEEAIGKWRDGRVHLGAGHFDVIVAAAEAYAATLPKTKMVEVKLVARMSADGKAVHFCQPDTPENRHEAGQYMLQYGGQLVTLKGVAEVPA